MLLFVLGLGSLEGLFTLAIVVFELSFDARIKKCMLCNGTSSV